MVFRITISFISNKDKSCVVLNCLNANDGIQLILRKEHISIIELGFDEIHEDEAGLRLARTAAGVGIHLQGPVESKVSLMANYRGLLKIDIPILDEINALPNIALATLPTNTVVERDEIVAGIKVIPLVVPETLLHQAAEIMQQGSIVTVKPFGRKRFGMVVTGAEVYYRRIPDSFGPVLTKKINEFGSEVLTLDIVPDDVTQIAATIKKQVVSGVEVILVTGGMSVDPDDLSPSGIRAAGVEIMQYGAPLMPGAMFLLGYLREIPVLGVPACSMYFQTTILDLVLPGILTGERIAKQDIIRWGHGGLCRSCEKCRFPHCSFGCGGARLVNG